MIKSIHEVTDAYKRQGRINEDAALYVLGISDAQQASSMAATPTTEFLLDVMSLVNEKLGGLIRKSKLQALTRSDFFELVSQSCNDAEDSWNSQGRSLPSNLGGMTEVQNYVARCVQAYRFGGRDADKAHLECALEYANRHGYTEEEASHVASMGTFLWPHLYLNGLDSSTWDKLFTEARNAYGFAAEGKGFHLPLPSNMTQSGSFVVAYYPDGSIRSYNLWHDRNDPVAIKHPECLQWVDDVFNADKYQDPEAIYVFVARGLICFFKAGGSVIEVAEIPRGVMHDSFLDVMTCGRWSGLLRIGSGFRANQAGSVCCIKDLVPEISKVIGWNAKDYDGPKWAQAFAAYYLEQ